MAPKRKRNEPDSGNTSESTSRAIRSSTRLRDSSESSTKATTIKPQRPESANKMEKSPSKTVAAAPPPKDEAASDEKYDEQELSTVQSAKGKRKTVHVDEGGGPSGRRRTRRKIEPSDASSPKKSRSSQVHSGPQVDDAAKPKAHKIRKTRDDEAAAGSSKTANAKHLSSTPTSKQQPYTSTRALTLFEKYADKDEPETIGPEGLESLCNDAEIPMDGAIPLILAWQLQAKEMGKFTREEWMDGMNELKIDTLPALVIALSDLQDLLITRRVSPKPPASIRSKNASLSSSVDRYSMGRYWTYASDVKAAFTKLYIYCFTLVKDKEARNIDMETATALWSVLLTPLYPIMSEIIEFIGEKGTYKGVNKDLWTMMYEFCQTVKPSLEGYDSDGAWPTLLDDFVLWKQNKIDIVPES